MGSDLKKFWYIEEDGEDDDKALVELDVVL